MWTTSPLKVLDLDFSVFLGKRRKGGAWLLFLFVQIHPGGEVYSCSPSNIVAI